MVSNLLVLAAARMVEASLAKNAHIGAKWRRREIT